MSRQRIRRRLNPEQRQRAGKTGRTGPPALEDSLTAQSDHPVLQLQRTIGNQATTVFLQRREEPGSATFVTSVSGDEYAQDRESFTRLLEAEQREDQTPSEEELMGAMEERAGETNFIRGTITKHPSIVVCVNDFETTPAPI